MTRAFVSTWHNFEEPFPTQYHKLYYEYFLENLPKWADLVDTIYFVYDNWDFTLEEVEQVHKIKPNAFFYKPDKSGPGNILLGQFLPMVHEDQILIMDNDCFIYDRKGVEFFFDKLDGHDLVGQFNNIGGLSEPMWKKYPFMRDHKYQSFFSNHYAVSKDFINAITPEDYYETVFYKEGEYIPALDYTTKKDDWEEGKMTMVCKLLDRNNFVDFQMTPNMGFHHLHSVSWAYLLLTHRKDQTYWDFIKGQPTEKSLKILNWFMTIDTKGKYTAELKDIIQDVLFNTVHYYQ